ncbi:MAG: GntR family transcriptional regulator [Victivallales bacterium]|jgi:GntR family transcriptional regulator
MDIKLNTESGVPIYLQIMRQIKLLVVCGSLKPGDQLPSVRDLSIRLRINPNTVARIYRELQHEKIIESKRGEGNYISENVLEPLSKEKHKIISESLNAFLGQARSFGYTDKEIREMFSEALSNKEKE